MSSSPGIKGPHVPNPGSDYHAAAARDARIRDNLAAIRRLLADPASRESGATAFAEATRQLRAIGTAAPSAPAGDQKPPAGSSAVGHFAAARLASQQLASARGPDLPESRRREISRLRIEIRCLQEEEARLAGCRLPASPTDIRPVLPMSPDQQRQRLAILKRLVAAYSDLIVSLTPSDLTARREAAVALGLYRGRLNIVLVLAGEK